jgi:hypothetical protein
VLSFGPRPNDTRPSLPRQPLCRSTATAKGLGLLSALLPIATAPNKPALSDHLITTQASRTARALRSTPRRHISGSQAALRTTRPGHKSASASGEPSLLKVTSPPLIAEPASSAVSLDRISQMRLSILSRGSMHSGQPGSPVPVSGISNIRYLSVICVIWKFYSFNVITTGFNARALRVPHTSFRGHYKGAGKGGSAPLTGGITASVIGVRQ